MAVRDIILTEKSVGLAQAGKFTFKVERTASLEEIKDEIEKTYNVHAIAVHTANLPAKTRGRGKFLGKKSAYKKAIVTLKKGEKIQAFVIETEEKKKEKKEQEKKKVEPAKEEKGGKAVEVKEKQFMRKAI